MLIKANGGKYWRLKYRLAGKEKNLAIGVYPDVSLKNARLARDEAKKLIQSGFDPVQDKQEQKSGWDRWLETAWAAGKRQKTACKPNSCGKSDRFRERVELKPFSMGSFRFRLTRRTF